MATETIPDGLAFIGVAEVENESVLQDLISTPELKDRNLRIIHFDSPDRRGVDVGLLYNPKYFKVLQARALPVDIATENGHKEFTRDVLYVVGKLFDDTFHIFVNHWPSRSGGEEATVWKRAKAASVSKSVIDSLMQINPNAKVIDMGDLNDDPTSPSVAKTLNAKGEKAEVKPGGLYNPWMQFYKKGMGTLGYNDSWSLFDQIIISYGFINANTTQWHYYKAEIFNRNFMKTQFGKYKGYPHRSFSGNNWIGGYSDHFPTVIYLIRDAQ
jgi:hypothetical protein